MQGEYMNENKYSTIQITQEYDGGWLKSLALRWVGKSDHVVVSRHLLDDTIFPCEMHLGGIAVIGPFELIVLSFNNFRDKVLLEMMNRKEKDVYYYGSVENKWNWTIL